MSLHRGPFAETLHPTDPVAFAHVDCDWYEPVALCLRRLHGVLAAGGLVIVDDYNDWGGCRRATDEFLSEVADMHVVTKDPHLVLERR